MGGLTTTLTSIKDTEETSIQEDMGMGAKLERIQRKTHFECECETSLLRMMKWAARHKKDKDIHNTQNRKLIHRNTN